MKEKAGGEPRSAALELLVVAADTVAVTRLPERGALTLGRDETCDVCIRNRSVSRRHAILHIDPGLRLEDLGSANGTFVRDARIPFETAGTHPLRRLSRETIDLSIGERANLGSVPILVRRTAERATTAGVVVRDPAMKAIHEQAARAAQSDISVLILGETGVGKEVLARSIHEHSPRAGKPYLELNCAALPPSLLEGELFGHEKSAFTGANQARAGLLESADGGTVFLDEVGELPLDVQVKLLRVLEDRKVMRVGGRAARQLDVRFIAATNRDVEREIARGTFREDLYFRLSGICFTLPPLRERPSEIGPLCEIFLAEEGQKLCRAIPLRISTAAMDYLQRHRWSGNVRELRNVLARAAVLCDGDVVLPADLPASLTGVSKALAPSLPAQADVIRPAKESPERPPAKGTAAQLREQLKAAEREQIVAALEQCAGNQTAAARLLGMPLRTLVKRLDEHAIPRPRKKSPDEDGV